MKSRIMWWVCGLGMVMLTGCPPSSEKPGRAIRAGDPLNRVGDEIVVCGRMYHTGTPVVLWLDPNGYDAYRCRRHFEPEETMPRNPVSKGNPNRYSHQRNVDDEMQLLIDDDGWTLENLQGTVEQFLIHYDACGTSRQCFKILQDVRGLSVHFMLDLDGTIYQTLDCKERAWHGGTANDQSVGIEIANIGAYPDMKTLDEWYDVDASGWPYVTLPAWLGNSGQRTPNFVARPARKEVMTGRIHDRELMQYDFTEQQYEALIKLTATLARVFPNMKLDYPRDAKGELRTNVLTKEEREAYAGLLAHWHVTTGKIDPGPAFDWDRVINGAKRELGRIE